MDLLSSPSSKSDDSDFEPYSESDSDEEKDTYDHIQIESLKEGTKLPDIEPDLNEDPMEAWEELEVLGPIHEESPIRQPSTNLNNSLSPIELFNMIITPDFWEFLASETNSYAEACKTDSNIKKRSRMTSWIATDEKEVMKYIGLILYTALHKKKGFIRYVMQAII